MQIHFDWTITPTTIISALWFFVVVPAYNLIKKQSDSMEQVLIWIKEYRLHAHTEHGENTPLTVGGIAFPRSMDGNK